MSEPTYINVFRVPAPVVDQAVDNILTINPGNPSSIDVRVSSWPFMSLGQSVSLHVCGQSGKDEVFLFSVADQEPLTRGELEETMWVRSIPGSFLAGLKDRSHLVFVFRVALDGGCCAEPLLFPTLSLEVQVPVQYEDLTVFAEGETAPWNGWNKGSAGQAARDWIVALDGEEYVLRNATTTNLSAGTVLVKDFADLEAGRQYEFGIKVHRTNTSYTAPKLSLVVGSDVVAEPTEFPGMAWETLAGTFTAHTPDLPLSIVSHVATGYGNDYAISRIWVKSI
ncbi:sugar-binding protein [Pseudomonas sp. NPDC087614]|uniref:sugar-binding protein n=1 Tax=Pseudomonas sp. NPDC087614 TaxID=3364442 RepID=UPI0037FC9F5E